MILFPLTPLVELRAADGVEPESLVGPLAWVFCYAAAWIGIGAIGIRRAFSGGRIGPFQLKPAHRRSRPSTAKQCSGNPRPSLKNVNYSLQIVMRTLRSGRSGCDDLARMQRPPLSGDVLETGLVPDQHVCARKRSVGWSRLIEANHHTALS